MRVGPTGAVPLLPSVDARHVQGLQVGNGNFQINQFLQPGSPAVARHAIWLPRQRTELLAGRDELLVEMRRQLAGPGPPGVRVRVLCGLGGVGKSSLAADYAHRHLATGDYRLIWWLSAADPTTVGPLLGRLLAAQLGVPDPGGDPVAAAHAVLAARPDPWLLIFDNVPGPAALEGLLPAAGPGHVLITSRNTSWARTQRIRVPELDRSPAARFLRERTGDPDPAAAAAAEKLADELGGLPLALEQAGAYITATGGSLRRYLELYRAQPAQLHQLGKPAGYPDTVATTWTVTFQALPAEAVPLLRLLACYAPDSIPLDLLSHANVDVLDQLDPTLRPHISRLATDPLRLDQAIAELHRYSLLTPSGTPVGGADPTAGTTVQRLASMHRLVQAVTLDQLKVDERYRWQQAACRLIEAAIPADPADPASWATYTVLLPHLRTLYHPPDTPLWLAALFLSASGNYQPARQLQQQILAGERKQLGPYHPDTLAAQHNLAATLYKLGDLQAARRLQQSTLDRRRRLLGNDHPDTLDAQNSLAAMLASLGDLQAARQLQQDTLNRRRRVLGNDHPDTLKTQHNLAIMLRSLGDLQAAHQLQQDNLAALRRLFGDDHPNTLAARESLANTLSSLGDLQAAGQLQQDTLNRRHRLFGDDHPDTLRTQHNLANTLSSLGDLQATRQLQQDNLAALRRLFGDDHPDTLGAQANLALTLASLGDRQAAHQIQQDNLDRLRRVLGDDHPDTLDAQANLAATLYKLGDLQAAHQLQQGNLDRRRRVLGDDHPNTLGAQANLAATLHELGDLQAARQLQQDNLDRRRRVLGDDHPDTLGAQHNLALTLSSFGWRERLHRRLRRHA